MCRAGSTPPTRRDSVTPQTRSPIHDAYNQWSTREIVQLMIHEYRNVKKTFCRKQILS